MNSSQLDLVQAYLRKWEGWIGRDPTSTAKAALEMQQEIGITYDEAITEIEKQRHEGSADQ